MRRSFWIVLVCSVLLAVTSDSTEYSDSRSFEVVNPDCYSTTDVNNDGITLSMADYIYLRRFVLGQGEAPPVLYQGDINGDCVIDQLDVELLDLFFQIGLSVFPEFPIPTCCEVDTIRGACCNEGDCSELNPINCSALPEGEYQGNGIWCVDVECPISCCLIVGDINHDGTGPDITDLVYLVTYMFSGGPDLPCMEEGDINGDLSVGDISDLVYLVTYMFSGGLAPAACQ